MKRLEPPIFCDCCAGFALAVLDGELLCQRCLLQRLASGATVELAGALPLGFEASKAGRLAPSADPTAVFPIEVSNAAGAI